MNGVTFDVCFVTCVAKALKRKDFHQRYICMEVTARHGTKVEVT